MWSGGRGLNSLLVIHKHTKEEIIYQWEGGDVKYWDTNGLGQYKWVGSILSRPSKLLNSIAIFACNRCSILYSMDCDQLIPSWAHSSIFQGATKKYFHCKILFDNLTGNQLLEALTLLWHLVINGWMEIVDEEDWEGIILIQGMPNRNNNKGYVGN